MPCQITIEVNDDLYRDLKEASEASGKDMKSVIVEILENHACDYMDELADDDA